MELIVISENKLKIMLTEPDMHKYELFPEKGDPSNLHTREVLRRIFEDAHSSVGFDAAGERLFVQMYTSKNGGCEIFVTKLEGGYRCFPAHMEEDNLAWGRDDVPRPLPERQSSRGEQALLDRIHLDGEESAVSFIEETFRIFAFSDVSHLIAVARRLKGVNFNGYSGLYTVRGNANVWYLTVQLPNDLQDRLPRRFAFLTEYGQEARQDSMELYLDEHGCLLRDGDAVEVLSEL